jgi:hypothetical protein
LFMERIIISFQTQKQQKRLKNQQRLTRLQLGGSTSFEGSEKVQPT